MAIISRALETDRSFTKMDNRWVRDRRLTGNARAILMLICSHSPGHKITKQYILDAGIAGREAVRKAFKQLEDLGYLRQAHTRSRGRYDGHDLYVSEPFVQAEDYRTSDGNPSVVEQQPLFEPDGNPYPESTETRTSNWVENDPLRRTEKNKKNSPLASLGGAERPAEDLIAKRAYDNTQGALSFMGVRQIAKWAIHVKGSPPAEVDKAIAELWKAGKPVTKALVGQYLDGLITPGRTHRPSRFEKNMAVVAELAAEERARQNQPLLAGTWDEPGRLMIGEGA